MEDDIYVEYGVTIEQLLDEYGFDLAMASVFEVECKCGEVFRLEPDGWHICETCGKKVESPLLRAGMI